MMMSVMARTCSDPVMIPAMPPMQVSAGAILDDVGVFVVILSMEGKIQFVNGAFARRTRRTSEAAVGKALAEAPWWSNRAALQQELNRAVDRALQGGSVRLDVEMAGPSQRFTVELEVRALRDASDTVVGAIAEGHDVTDQRVVERKLREAHFRWRTIADFTVDWEFWLHPGGHFLYASPSCQRLCGYAPDDFMDGRATLSSIAHPEDRRRIVDLMTEAFTGTTRHNQRWRIVRRDGVVRSVSMSWQPVQGENGRFMGVRGSVRDVTDLAQAEEKTERLLEAYGTLARHFPKGLVAIVDHELRFVVCDGPAVRAMQLDPETIVGRTISDVLDPGLFGRMRPLLTKAREGREVSDIIEFGGMSWLVQLTPIPDGAGRICHIIASAVESRFAWAESEEQPTRPGHTA
jgi:PAS domain S-box-containing protein